MSSFVSVPPVSAEKKLPAWAITDDERSILSCSRAALLMFAGPCAKEIMKHVEEVYEYPIRRAQECGLREVIDVRVNFLMPGHCGNMPGWHSDGVPIGGYSAQPNYSLVHPLAFNVSVLHSDQAAGVAGIEFVDDHIKPHLYNTDAVFRNVHEEILRIKPRTRMTTDGWMMWYHPKSVLREVPAHRAGRRLSFRFRMIEKPMYSNKVMNQTEVYVNPLDGNQW